MNVSDLNSCWSWEDEDGCCDDAYYFVFWPLFRLLFLLFEPYRLFRTINLLTTCSRPVVQFPGNEIPSRKWILQFLGLV